MFRVLSTVEDGRRGDERPRCYFGEYLTKGRLKIEGKCARVDTETDRSRAIGAAPWTTEPGQMDLISDASSWASNDLLESSTLSIANLIIATSLSYWILSQEWLLSSIILQGEIGIMWILCSLVRMKYFPTVVRFCPILLDYNQTYREVGSQRDDIWALLVPCYSMDRPSQEWRNKLGDIRLRSYIIFKDQISRQFSLPISSSNKSG
jgi:hypothetical protein